MIQDTLERHVTTTRPAAQRARKMVAEPKFVQLPLSHFPLLAPVVARLAALAAPEERCWVFRAHGALPGWVVLRREFAVRGPCAHCTRSTSP